MALKVRANYDFEAQPGSGELTIHTGEVLVVIRRGIEGGWMEGQNAKGKIGLFPESYVSTVPLMVSQPTPSAPAYSEPPSFPLPPLPKKGIDDPWDNPQSAIIPPSYVPPTSNTNVPEKPLPSELSTAGNAQSAPTFSNIYPQVPPTGHFNDPDFDDDWSDEEEEEFASDVTSQQFKAPLSSKTSNAGDLSSIATRQTGASKMKTINRFSNFVKTGMESFILSGSRLSTPSNEHYEIVFKNNQIEWKPPQRQYTCVVNKPKKESKLKGLKSFIAYSLTCSLSGIQVSRRYKHFDWLHEQLSNKYLLVPIPPLPEKQVSGRYEDDLIEHRKSILQLWVNKICRHPVLSQSEVWKHFITCTDTAAKWKAGKRAAEKDEYVGGNFFHCISVPPQPLLYDIKQINNIDQQVDNYAKSVRSMDDSIRELHDRITDTQKRMIGPYKSNWQKMAAAFDSLGRSLEMDQTKAENPVKNALKTSAHVLHKIGTEHEEHGKRGLEPILDYLYTYKGLYTSIPEIVNVHKSALSKMRDIKAEGRLPPADAEAIRERVDVATYAMMAEISHLNQERDNDFRQMFGEFFAQQAAFYTNMGTQMAELAETFQKAI